MKLGTLSGHDLGGMGNFVAGDLCAPGKNREVDHELLLPQHSWET
jgi:hypothetical protein